MKKLLLNRHAEAGSPAGVNDFERPLTQYGLQQVTDLGAKLIKANLRPDAWLTSTALRAQSTALGLTGALDIELTRRESSIYEASEKTLLKLINQLPDEYAFVGLTGHNPGIAYLFYSLCNEIRDVPPCAALLVELDAESWAHVSAGIGTLKWYSA